MPKVSIIMPIYNKEKYLKATLDSVVNQTWKDWELVAVNDGSTDESLSILKRYQSNHPQIRIINQRNRGVSAARNAGLKAASGKWIQFLDGDDRMNHEYLNLAVPAAESQQAQILFSNFNKVDMDGNLINRVGFTGEGFEPKTIRESTCCDQHDLCDLFIKLQYQNGFFGFISNKLFQRDLLETSGAQFPEEISLAEDLDFFVQLYPAVKKAVFLNRVSFYYLQTETNYCNNDHIDYFSQLKIQMDIRNWFIKVREYTEHSEILNLRVSDYVYYSVYYAFEDQENVRKIFDRIAADKEILSCISLQKYKGFQKAVLRAICENNYDKVIGLLTARSKVRSIYRRMFQHGKDRTV